MIKKIIAIGVFFYFLALLETSFFAHFTFLNVLPSFTLLAVALINLLESPSKNLGLWAALLGGFFLDIFAGDMMGFGFFGFYILLSLLIAFCIKYLFRQYVRIPVIKRF